MLVERKGVSEELDDSTSAVIAHLIRSRSLWNSEKYRTSFWENSSMSISSSLMIAILQSACSPRCRSSSRNSPSSCAGSVPPSPAEVAYTSRSSRWMSLRMLSEMLSEISLKIELRIAEVTDGISSVTLVRIDTDRLSGEGRGVTGEEEAAMGDAAEV